ncbi:MULTISPECIES: DUF6635 family protein [Pacificibacter]|uniref:DUF6635 family protein n=1 Tax=Pacificibacter TaxID=1042323 RepID=UPI0020903EA1|nr:MULTISPECIES: DUF6635 family protein [Pacificibacter]MDO6614802.1 hypothetical protein [Pacificibacter sp. 1_MG-2023]
MSDVTSNERRRAEVNAFVRATFGVRGTLRLHRFAFGFDLLRAPANVLLAPVFLVIQLSALIARTIRCHKASIWLSQRQIFLETNVSQQVAKRVMAFIRDLETRGNMRACSKEIVEHEIANYTGVRSAVSEITTTLVVIIVGIIAFQTVTLGVISITGQVAELRAHAHAIANFPLGQGLGRLYYGVFSTDLKPWELVATGVVLSMLASVVTTFAGVIADPLQVITGTHRRRLCRLINRLEVASDRNNTIAQEHITARLADLTDVALNLWRSLRG